MMTDEQHRGSINGLLHEYHALHQRFRYRGRLLMVAGFLLALEIVGHIVRLLR